MSTIPTKTEAPDELDQLFSDFFKAQLKHPWPNAPIPAAGGATPATEPSGLVTSRTETPRNAPTPAPQAKGRDSIARARFTLAASVALALGACWALSNGFEPTTQSNTPSMPKLLPESGADGKNSPTFQKMQENNATGNTGNTNPGIKIEKIGDGNEEE